MTVPLRVCRMIYILTWPFGQYDNSGVQVAHLFRKEEKVVKAHTHARLLAKNYKCLLLMCERHPAHSKVLVLFLCVCGIGDRSSNLCTKLADMGTIKRGGVPAVDVSDGVTTLQLSENDTIHRGTDKTTTLLNTRREVYQYVRLKLGKVLYGPTGVWLHKMIRSSSSVASSPLAVSIPANVPGLRFVVRRL